MPIKPFDLQFPAAQLQHYADAYSYNRNPAAAIAAGEAAQDGGYSRDGLLDVVKWKAARRQDLITSTDAVIRATTADAFETNDEVERMEKLTELPGIGVPQASALLLFALGEDFPILDVNALEALGHRGRGQYPASFWVRYLNHVRALAAANGMTPRQVDKALWEFRKQQKANC